MLILTALSELENSPVTPSSSGVRKITQVNVACERYGGQVSAYTGPEGHGPWEQSPGSLATEVSYSRSSSLVTSCLVMTVGTGCFPGYLTSRGRPGSSRQTWGALRGGQDSLGSRCRGWLACARKTAALSMLFRSSFGVPTGVSALLMQGGEAHPPGATMSWSRLSGHLGGQEGGLQGGRLALSPPSTPGSGLFQQDTAFLNTEHPRSGYMGLEKYCS